MCDWNLTIEATDIPYSFWSFSRHGQGRNTYGIFDATLGFYQTHPLNFKSTEDALVIEGANNPSKKIINWKTNNKGRWKNLSALIYSSKDDSNKIFVEIAYSSNKYSFELKNMEQNEKLNTISKTDLDLIIKTNFQMNMIFDVITLICEYNTCIFDMNNNMKLLEYHDIKESETENIINTINAPRNSTSYVSLNINNEIINGNYDKFIVECECKPYLQKNMNIAGIVSLHGPGTGWELRVSNRYGNCRFEWVFTTQWMENTYSKWMHNELAFDIFEKKDNNNENDEMCFDLLVKIYPNGKMSTYLKNMKLSNTILCKQDYGKICYVEIGTVRFGDPRFTMFLPYTLKVKQLNLIGAGSGITPLYQIITNINLNKEFDETEISLIYCNRSAKDILLKDDLEDIAAKNKNIKIHFVIERVNDSEKIPNDMDIGRITKDICMKHLFSPNKIDNDVVSLLCGPYLFEEAVKKFLDEIGYDKKSVASF
eukprot:376349_1